MRLLDTLLKSLSERRVPGSKLETLMVDQHFLSEDISAYIHKELSAVVGHMRLKE